MVDGTLSSNAEWFYILPNGPFPTVWVFLVHGTGVPHTVWLDWPDPIMITREALDRGYAVVALKSVADDWDTTQNSPGLSGHTNLDLLNYDLLVEEMNSLSSPFLGSFASSTMFAIGGSGGGNFVAFLTQHVKAHPVSPPISAAGIQIANAWTYQRKYDLLYTQMQVGHQPASGTLSSSTGGFKAATQPVTVPPFPYYYGRPVTPSISVPPVYMVVGEQDTLPGNRAPLPYPPPHTVQNLPHFMKNLDQDPNHSEEAHLVTNEIEPIYPSSFEFIDGIDPATSQEIYDVIDGLGYLNPNGYLTHSMREPTHVWQLIWPYFPIPWQDGAGNSDKIRAVLLERSADHGVSADERTALFDMFARHVP